MPDVCGGLAENFFYAWQQLWLFCAGLLVFLLGSLALWWFATEKILPAKTQTEKYEATSGVDRPRLIYYRRKLAPMIETSSSARLRTTSLLK